MDSLLPSEGAGDAEAPPPPPSHLTSSQYDVLTDSGMISDPPENPKGVEGVEGVEGSSFPPHHQQAASVTSAMLGLAVDPNPLQSAPVSTEDGGSRWMRKTDVPVGDRVTRHRAAVKRSASAVNEGIRRLGQKIHGLDATGLSRITILEAALKYIDHLHDVIQRLEQRSNPS